MSTGGLLGDLAGCLERARATSSKSEKIEVIASYLRGLGPDDAEIAARLAAGRASERGSRDEVQVGYSTLIGILEEICGVTPREVSSVYLKHGDLGEVAEEVLAKKKETTLFPEQITLRTLEAAFEEMRGARGKGAAAARRSVTKSLLLRATPLEGKYIVKALTGEMRTGVVAGIVEAAVAKAYSIEPGRVAVAHMLLGDTGQLAKAAALGELGKVKMAEFRPVNFMLAEPMASSKEVAEHFGKEVYAEYKYDGVRAQVHKLGKEVRIYSRRLEEITSSFPEVVGAAGRLEHDFVMDGEIVPFAEGRPLPFQLLQRRLRRIQNFAEAATVAPVQYFAFDILLLDGEELYQLPLSQRTRRLEAALRGGSITRAERSTAATEAEFERFFRRSRDLGYEGLVVKDPESSYTMGRRGAGWVKLKEELDTIDAVIVEAEYGHGKRVGVISDYTFAVRDRGSLKVIGKAYSGLTDEEIDSMTERLKRITVKDFGHRRTVRPEIVLEVAFDSIQRSDRHGSGYALRFPRIKRIREDKSVDDIDSLDKVAAIFESQTVRISEP
ncbi:MAG TPA: ATP-dependent DNA ligase [Nitrososphaerales archaeon]|nr:ATP-dependent DNA ligase [Nitrososphaerales archaeon]